MFCEKRYYDQYLSQQLPVYRIFDGDARNIKYGEKIRQICTNIKESN